VTAGGDAGSTGYICAYGRFDFDGVDAEIRVRTPLQRVDGEFRAVTWEDALNVFTGVCGNAGSVATVTSGNLFNEDLLTLRRLSEAAGFQEPCSTVAMYGDALTLIGKEVDIDAADLIVLVGLAPSQWERVFPALDVKLRRLVRRGTPLVVVNAKDTRIAEVAQVSLPGEEAQSLRVLIEALDKDPAASEQPGEDRIAADEAVCRVAELYAQAEQPVILTLAAFSQLSRELASKKGDVVTVPFEANGKGTVLMGITGVPEVGADRAVDGPEVLYALGDFNIARPENVGFLVVQATHLTGLAREADLVLPVPTPYESHGTIVDYTESLRVLAPVIAPHAESRSHREILQAIGERLGLDIAVAETEDVLEQIHTFRAEKSSLRPPESRRFHCDPRNPLFGLDGPTRYSPRLFRLRDLQHPETVAQAV
jgi:NADH dehydrogenase/NADH:ubiquinone oxidoreductase subunit G